MKEIASVNNETVKDRAKLQQKKHRNQTGLFLIEGLKGVEEAINSGIKIKDIFISNYQLSKNEILPQNKIYLVTEPIMKKISSTETPPEIIAVAHQLEYKLQDILNTENPLILILESTKDAGNLGTIIRSAAAFGCSGIVLVGDTVDIYNPKVVRSTVGNLWKIPIINELTSDIKEKINVIKKCNFLATTVSEKQSDQLNNCNLKKPTVVMFGSEAEGISQELLQIADSFITIPMKGSVESLNLSVSAGIVLYESLRQRLYD